MKVVLEIQTKFLKLSKIITIMMVKTPVNQVTCITSNEGCTNIFDTSSIVILL